MADKNTKITGYAKFEQKQKLKLDRLKNDIQKNMGDTSTQMKRKIDAYDKIEEQLEEARKNLDERRAKITKEIMEALNYSKGKLEKGKQNVDKYETETSIYGCRIDDADDDDVGLMQDE